MKAFRRTTTALIVARAAMLLFTACLLAHPAHASSSAPRSISVSSSSSLNKFWQERWDTARELAALEQKVEDYNAEWIATSASAAESTRHRRLICLPLDATSFDPPPGVFSHGHVQTGDKMSLPKVFWQAIQLNHAEVPWLFRLRRLPGITGPRFEYESTKEEDQDEEEEEEESSSIISRHEKDSMISEHRPMVDDLQEVVGGPLDFRAPASYVFLPWWMMRALGLRPRDIVEVELVSNVPPGSLTKLRPHSSQFAKDISNPQAVMETELRHYSSLTQGSTIAFDYNKQRYWFDVVECRSAPRGEKVPMIKVQDCDIATDFLPAKDTLKHRKRKQRDDEL